MIGDTANQEKAFFIGATSIFTVTHGLAFKQCVAMLQLSPPAADLTFFASLALCPRIETRCLLVCHVSPFTPVHPNNSKCPPKHPVLSRVFVPPWPSVPDSGPRVA